MRKDRDAWITVLAASVVKERRLVWVDEAGKTLNGKLSWLEQTWWGDVEYNAQDAHTVHHWDNCW